MDQPNRPDDVTQGVPPAQPPAYPPAEPTPPAAGLPAEPTPPAYPPAAQPPAYPPAEPSAPAAWPPPPAYPAAQPPPPTQYPAQAWPGPVEPLGPAPGLQFAPHGARLVAYIVDAILIGVLVTAVAIALALLTAGLAAVGAGALAALSILVLIVATPVVGFLYFPWFWVHGGATPGMRIFNLRVVRDADGGPIGWGAALLRLIGFWVSSLVFYLGFIWILVDKRRRGWHDLLAGTVMVQPV
jgi:uncharacterized RDD family membrane protein YckC